MFGSDDQNQNVGAVTPATDTAQTDAPATDVTAAAPTAPTLADPMITEGASQPPSATGVSVNNTAMTSSAPPADSSSDDLMQIKQQALQNLEPLVGQLDQAPDEKFKTIMMLIQASDNPKLVKEAYDAANQITDEKVRAQALLDVVNEINYFTQQSQSK